MERTEACIWRSFGDHSRCLRCLRCRLRFGWVWGVGVPWSFRRGSDCIVGCFCFPRPCHVMGVCCAACVGVVWPPVVASFLRRPSSLESHSPCAVADRPARKTPKAAGLQAKQLKPHWGSGGQGPTSGSASLRQIPSICRQIVAPRSQAKKSLSETHLPGTFSGEQFLRGPLKAKPCQTHQQPHQTKTQTETIWVRAICTRRGCEIFSNCFDSLDNTSPAKAQYWQSMLQCLALSVSRLKPPCVSFEKLG